jgi:transposase
MDPAGFLLTTVELTSPWDACNAPLAVLPPGPAAASPRIAPPCCPFCGNKARAHDVVAEQRSQLNSLLTNAYLHALIPQVTEPENNAAGKQVEVPWARTGSEFTQLFEALVMALIRRIPVKAAAAILGTADARLWRLVDREAGKGEAEPCRAGFPVLERRSGRKGRDFLNLFYDLDVSFDTRLEQGSTDVPGGELTVNNELGRVPGLVFRELSQALILAALSRLVRAALAYQHFRRTKLLNRALGKVGAEEGMLAPGKSRAPPRRD